MKAGTMNGNNATKGQIACIHAMIHKLKLAAQKDDLIYGATNHRSASVGDLTLTEAKTLIQYLKSQDPEEKAAEVMRKKIISLAWEMGWVSVVDGQRKADMKRIDTWMVHSSLQHKKLNQYRYKELPALVTQFEKVYQSFIKSI